MTMVRVSKKSLSICLIAAAVLAVVATTGSNALAARRRGPAELTFPATHKERIEAAWTRDFGTDVAKAIELTEKTFKFVGDNPTAKKLRPKFDALKKETGKDAYLKIRWLRRELILSHPTLNFEKLLINKRGPTGYSHQCDQYLGRHGRPGAGLTVVDNWKTEPKAKEILVDKLPVGTTLHPDLSYDGKKILFGYCDATNPNKNERRYWIWECAIDGSGLKQLTGTKKDILKTWGGRHTVLVEDWDPCYLPEGGFVFISTRAQAFGRCHGSRYTPSYLMYRANADGSNIHQISYGEANEWDPCVMYDGRIVYTRWDYINRHDVKYQSLWSTRPDGTDVKHYYGNYTANPQLIVEARPIPGTSKVVSVAAGHHSYTAGSLIVIDTAKGEDGPKPLTRITPEAKFTESEGWPNPFTAPWPLNERLYLSAHTHQRQARQGSINSTNAYGIFLVDDFGGRELIYRDTKMSSFAPIPIRARKVPQILPSAIDPNNKNRTAKIIVQDVYETRVKGIEPGTIAALRINQIHGQPNNSKTNPSIANNEILKHVLGTVPVQSDGSVAFTVPAGEPMQLQLVDKNGMAVLTMRSLVYFQPGEASSCVGCHENRGMTPLPKKLKATGSFPVPTPPKYTTPDNGLAFMQTVQPVLDKNCIKCHGLGKEIKGKMNLMGKKGRRYAQSYDSLTGKKGLIVVAYRNRETAESKIKEYYAHAGTLIKHLMSEKHQKNVKLSKDDMARIVDWLDLNCQFYGDYEHEKEENRRISADNEKAIRALIKAELGDEIAAQPIEALVNVGYPRQSRVLRMPLATSAGGWGQVKKWSSTDDAGYKKLAELIDKSLPVLKKRDIHVWRKLNQPGYQTISSKK
ncbi:MAG: hypothetical protein QGG42_19800 [Phycisphaerae bacterium]|nr:hypothetical protein [Phycisphaerae bacterium]